LSFGVLTHRWRRVTSTFPLPLNLGYTIAKPWT
jgi:hypothetical protein